MACSRISVPWQRLKSGHGSESVAGKGDPFQSLKGGACLVASTREIKHHTRKVGELRFIMPAGPEELTLQVLSPELKGYRVFIHAQA